MRKCRKLADKMKIITFAVLMAVSAFFYAPMEVSAEEFSASGSSSQINVSLSGSYSYYDVSTNSLNFGDYDSEFVEVSMDISYIFSSSRVFAFLGHSVLLHCGDIVYCVSYSDALANRQGISSFSEENLRIEFLCKSSDLQNVFLSVGGTTMTVNDYPSGTTTSYSLTSTFDLISVSPVSGTDVDEYQNGYNAGYSAGEQVGYGNGYSNGFADGEASVDTDKIYDDGFQAGKDSVDTQSYYDAGYHAGYQAAYFEGYENGYDEGYQSAMDRIDGWGADTSDYPILLETLSNDGDYALIDSSSVFPYSTRGWLFLGKFVSDINPSHTYKLVFDSSKVELFESDIIYSEFYLNYRIGNNSYKWYFGENFYYVSGSDMSSTIFLDVDLFGVESVSDSNSGQLRLGFDYIDVYLYDMGPSGDTQNHIANQTDSLTNGFDNSQGNTVNSDLSSGLNEYQTSEDTLWATATTGLKDFTFFDFASVPAMITGMSFVTAIMGSWFNQAGGASGVGIVLSILFSVVLVAMVLGLYRWYQSRGGKD